MWWGIGGAFAFLWIILFFWLGLTTLRNGHGWLFFFGLSCRSCGSRRVHAARQPAGVERAATVRGDPPSGGPPSLLGHY